MSVFREIPPTAGWPIYLKDMFGVVVARNTGSLEDDFRAYSKCSYARLTNSGTTALYLILETFKDVSAARTVVVPSYICPLVVLAIARSGLKVAVCDITGRDFSFDPLQLSKLCAKKGEILAIIAAHIAGIPVDMGPVKRIAAECGAFVIEDCAQSLGALSRGNPVGTSADASFFSLCRGKGLTIYEGGVITVSDSRLAGLLDAKAAKLVKSSFFAEALKVFELFGYWLLYRPLGFWFVFQLPRLFWTMRGRPLKADSDEYAMDFPVHRVSFFRRHIGHLAFHNLQREIRGQREKAAYYIKNLCGLKGLRLVVEREGDLASYPFLMAVFESSEARDRVYSALSGLGLGVSQVYSAAVTEYDYLGALVPREAVTAGSLMARNSISLSTSRFLTPDDLSRVVTEIRRLMS